MIGEYNLKYAYGVLESVHYYFYGRHMVQEPDLLNNFTCISRKLEIRNNRKLETDATSDKQIFEFGARQALLLYRVPFMLHSW